MKIFEIYWPKDDQKSWIAANSIIGAIQTYCANTDFMLCDFDGDEEITEIYPDTWDNFSVTDEDEKIEQSFTEWMKENKYPDIIAETFYS